MAADAGLEVARTGGNAVDVCIAASVASLCTETVIASLGGGGFVTISPLAGDPVTIDGYVEMPGRGLPASRLGGGAREVDFGYGGGVRTSIGPGSVATPGTVAALDRAWTLHGRLPWARILEPARRLVEEGFPLTPAAEHYLEHSGEPIFGWDPEARRALRGEDGGLPKSGETVRIPDLARSLEILETEGAESFYTGELAERIARRVRRSGGMLGLEDLAAYEPIVRPALEVELDGWTVATNPPPAIGGATLAAMLLLMHGHPSERWSEEELERLARVQEAVLGWRIRELDGSDDLHRDVRRLLEERTLDDLRRWIESPSTVHTSAVDADGLACSISASTGYGSGVVAPGTGIFLNNCLGEQELVPGGVGSPEIGSRLPSNMAPSTARGPGGAVLAVGSPGAGRITTALLQTLLSFFRLGMTLEEAVAHPRLHVELDSGRTVVACEPGLDLEGTGLELRPFEWPDMFFGGVTGALRREDGAFEAAADPRRTGGVAVFEAEE